SWVMTKLLPAAAERWITSSVDMNVAVIPVMGASGSPILKSSAVGVNQGTPTFFLIRATTSRAVKVDGDWPSARTSGDATRRPLPVTWQNFLRESFISFISFSNSAPKTDRQLVLRGANSFAKDVERG